MRVRATQVAVAFALVGLVGCPPPPKKPTDGTTVTVEGDPPDFPGDFTPGAPLPDPPAPEPGQYGLAYLEQVYPSLRDGWTAFLEDARLRLPPDHPLNSPTLEAKVEIVVDKDGHVAGVKRLTSSGSSEFDLVAEEVAGDAGPFPAPPRELLSDDDKVYLTWLFARDRRQAGVATAELRRTEWPLERAVPKLIADGNLTEAARRLRAAASGAVGDPSSPAGAQLIALATQVMVESLREGLRAEDVAAQRAAIEGVIAVARADGAASRSALAPAAQELRAIADGSVEVEVRARAITALGAMGEREVVGFVQNILDKDQGANPVLSGAAAAALVTLGAGDAAKTSITSWFTSGERAKLGGALATLARAAVPGLTATIAKQIAHPDLGVKIAACGALGPAADGDANAWKSLRRGLDDRDATVRAACASAAAQAAATGARNRAAYLRLIELTKDRDSRVRAAAVLAALRLDPKRAPDELGRLNKEKEPHVLAALAEGYAVVPAAKGGTPPKRLVDLAGHADTGVRAAAVRALASRREAKARQLAASLIVDPELEVRLAALAALDDPAQLGTLAADATPEVAGEAQARRIVRLGGWAALAEAMDALAAAPAQSAARARIAAAWLRAA